MGLDRGVGRRGFLAAASAIAAAVAAPAGRTRAQSTREEYAGKLVFSYDDSPVEDYTKTFPVHRDEGVPACIAAVSGRLGDDDSLSVEQLREIESAGWEVMSHTIDHRPMGSIRITRDVGEGDRQIYVQANFHGNYRDERVEIYDGEKRVTAAVAGKGVDRTGEIVFLKESIGESFEGMRAFIQFTADRIRTSLRDSRDQLEDYGFEVSNLVLPFGNNGGHARELAPVFYDGVPNATWDGDGRNDYEGLDPYSMHRAYFRDGEMTVDELEAWLDELAEGNYLGLLGGHSHYERLTADRIRTAIRMAKDRDIEILTLRDAFDDLGITGEKDRWTPEPTTVPSATLGTWTPRGGGAATDAPASSTEQSGFGIGAALAGAGVYAWRRMRK